MKYKKIPFIIVFIFLEYSNNTNSSELNLDQIYISKDLPQIQKDILAYKDKTIKNDPLIKITTIKQDDGNKTQTPATQTQLQIDYSVIHLESLLYNKNGKSYVTINGITLKENDYNDKLNIIIKSIYPDFINFIVPFDDKIKSINNFEEILKNQSEIKKIEINKFPYLLVRLHFNESFDTKSLLINYWEVIFDLLLSKSHQKLKKDFCHCQLGRFFH